jgi:ubiquinol-cytochrome c reductase cytochrome c subunit
VRFLSAKRRHRAARPLLLILALFLMGLVYAGFAPTGKSSADETMTTAVKEGQELFAVGCSSCHGLNAEGTSQGPSLVGVGAAAVDFQVGTGRMPMAQPGPQFPRKPSTYTDEEITQLASFVASLGPGPEIPKPEAYSPDQLSEEDVALGGELFRTNCSACHNVSGLGGALPNGKYAPSLVDVENKHIYEALRTGPQQMPVFSEGVLTDGDVRMIIGYLNTLAEEQDRGGWSFGGLGPVEDGFWVFFGGILTLIIAAVWIASKGVRAK